MIQDAAQAQSRTPRDEAHQGIETSVKQEDAAQTQNLTPHAEPRYGFGTTEVLRLFDHINTRKAFVCVLALCLIINGLLFYRYEPGGNSVPPTTAPASQSVATWAEDGEGRRAEARSEENDTRPAPIDHEQQDNHPYLRGTEPASTEDLSPYLLSSAASMGQVQNARSGLQELLEKLPDSQEDAREQLEELVTFYEAMENSPEEVTPQQGVEDAVNEAAPQAQEVGGEAEERAQDAAGQATYQGQETAKQASEEAQGAAQGTAEQARNTAGEATEQEAQGLGGLGGFESQSGVGEDEDPDATRAAEGMAERLGVDLSEVEGSGVSERITLTDVLRTAQG
jgi:hypothetical protein